MSARRQAVCPHCGRSISLSDLRKNVTRFAPPTGILRAHQRPAVVNGGLWCDGSGQRVEAAPFDRTGPWEADRPTPGEPIAVIQSWYDRWCNTPGFWEEQVVEATQNLGSWER